MKHNSFMRPVEVVREYLGNPFHKVSFAGHSYWIKDNLGKFIVGCPTFEMADFMREKINSSEGFIDLNLLRCQFIQLNATVDGFTDEVDIEANDPEELAKTDPFYEEQADITKFHSKKKTHKKRDK